MNSVFSLKYVILKHCKAKEKEKENKQKYIKYNYLIYEF